MAYPAKPISSALTLAVVTAMTWPVSSGRSRAMLTIEQEQVDCAERFSRRAHGCDSHELVRN